MIHRPRYSFADTPDSYRAAANTLAAGRGPFAIDTERASAFRYDDRAFLVQIHRRDAGTFLIAPEGKRDDVKAIFAPIINEREWVLHAAAEDLESLGLLGLHPKTVFDTELAARLCGFQRPNLKAVVHQVLNVELEKIMAGRTGPVLPFLRRGSTMRRATLPTSMTSPTRWRSCSTTLGCSTQQRRNSVTLLLPTASPTHVVERGAI